MSALILKNYCPSLKTRKNQSLNLKNSSLKVKVSYVKAESDKPEKNESDESSVSLKNEENLTFYWLHLMSYLETQHI